MGDVEEVLIVRVYCVRVLLFVLTFDIVFQVRLPLFPISELLYPLLKCMIRGRQSSWTHPSGVADYGVGIFIVFIICDRWFKPIEAKIIGAYIGLPHLMQND